MTKGIDLEMCWAKFLAIDLLTIPWSPTWRSGSLLGNLHVSRRPKRLVLLTSEVRMSITFRAPRPRKSLRCLDPKAYSADFLLLCRLPLGLRIPQLLRLVLVLWTTWTLLEAHLRLSRAAIGVYHRHMD
jgi:hypothetical protein